MKNVNKWSLDDVKAIVNRVSELDENYASSLSLISKETTPHPPFGKYF